MYSTTSLQGRIVFVPKSHSSLRGGSFRSDKTTDLSRYCKEPVHLLTVIARSEASDAIFPATSLRGAKRRGNLWYPKAIRTGMRGRKKRDCHAPLRGARNDNTWDSQWQHPEGRPSPQPSLRGGTVFVPTWQSLVSNVY